MEALDRGGSIVNLVIRLLPGEQKITRELNLLAIAGFEEDDFQVITHDREGDTLRANTV